MGTPKKRKLWEYMEQIIHSKGAHALKVSKVKGHATAKHIRDGTHRLSDKVGNDMADHLADCGVGEHGSDVVNLAIFTLKGTKTCES